jgi:hypothetical protein
MRNTSLDMSTPQNAQGRANIDSALPRPSKRRCDVVLDTSDEETPERALSKGLIAIEITTHARHRRKRRAMPPDCLAEDEHISDASTATQPRQYQANTQIQRADTSFQNAVHKPRLSTSSPPRCLRENCRCGGHVWCSK